MILEPGTNVRGPAVGLPVSASPKTRKTGSPCVANAWTVLALVRCVAFRYILWDREMCPFEGVGRSAPRYALYVLLFSGKQKPGCGSGRPVGRVERHRGYSAL